MGGSVFKLTNIPTLVGIEKLRSILEQRQVGGFYITRLEVGEFIVKFRADMQVVVDKLEGLKMDDCIIKKEVLSKVPAEDIVEQNDTHGNQGANGGGGIDINVKVKEQGEEVGPKDDHVHDWSTEADQDQDRDLKEDARACIEEISKHDEANKTDRKKGYGGLIQGKEKTKSKSRVESISAKKKKNNWAIFKLSNLPGKATMSELRRALKGRGISGGLDIMKLGGGFGRVSIQNDLQMKTLKDFKMGDQNIKIELVETSSSDVHETESNSRQVSLPKPGETESNIFGLFDVPPVRVKVPKHVTEAVMKDLIGLNSFVPEFCEISQGEVAFVYEVGQEFIEIMNTLSNCINNRIKDTVLGKDVSVKDGSEDDPTYVAEQPETSVDNVMINDQEKNGGKCETPNDADDGSRSQPEVLIPVEAVFASMDVREKVKVIQQAKNKSLGDFLIPSNEPQGPLKKKKKEEKQ